MAGAQWLAVECALGIAGWWAVACCCSRQLSWLRHAASHSMLCCAVLCCGLQMLELAELQVAQAALFQRQAALDLAGREAGMQVQRIGEASARRQELLREMQARVERAAAVVRREADECR